SILHLLEGNLTLNQLQISNLHIYKTTTSTMLIPPLPLLIQINNSIIITLNLNSLPLPLILVRPPNCNILWFIITKQRLQRLLHDPASNKIQCHSSGKHKFKIVIKLDQSHLLIDLRDELCRTRKGNSGNTNETVVHGLVLLDALAEGSALVVDGEGRD